MFYKPEIRKPIRARRKHLTPIAIQQSSLFIASRLIHLPQLLEAQHIGYYLPQENEVDPSPIIQTKILQTRRFYLPVIASQQDKLLAFYSHQEGDKLQSNHYGILEPATSGKIPIDLHFLDIIFIPIVAFDKYCNRLGRGAGYYDKTFAFINETPTHQKRPFLVGLAYEFQKISEIIPSKWDVPLDMVVSEDNIYTR